MKSINIISISDGNEEDLNKTILSVKSQSIKKYKHIIIAKKLSKKFIKNNKYNKLFFIVGKDKSRYDAMNIGENISNKKYVLYLNSGDIFYSNKSLHYIFHKLIFKSNLNGQFVSVLKYKNYFFYPRKSFFNNNNSLTHSSYIRAPIKKKKQILFNTEHLITADGDWMKKNIRINGIKKFYIPISLFSLDGISTLPSLKTINIKKKLGSVNFFKEIIKFILVKTLSRTLFYKLIYCTKYKVKNEKIY